MENTSEFIEKTGNAADNQGSISVIEIGFIENRDVEKKTSVTFDEALAQTEFGKFNYFIILLAGIIITYALIETIGVSFILPVSQCDLNLTTRDKGIVSAIGFIGIITSSYLWGFLADTIGRRRVIRPTLFMSCFLAALSSLAKYFWLFVILRYLTCFFASGASATIYVYLGEFHTNKARSSAIMGASFIFGTTLTLFPAFAWLVINQEWSFYIPILDITYKPWRLFLVVCGLPSLFCALCLLKIPESPKFLLSQGKQKETLEILKKIYSMNTGKNEEEYKIDSAIVDAEAIPRPKAKINKSNPIASLLSSMWDQTAPLFMKKYLRTSILTCVIQFGIYATSNGLYMWFPSIINEMAVFMEKHPGSKATICSIVYDNEGNMISEDNEEILNCNETLEISTYQYPLVLEVLGMIGFAIMAVIINAVGKIPILFVILVACGSCGIAITIVDIPLIAVYLFVILFLSALGVTVVNAAMVDLYPTHLRAMAVCIALLMGRVGSVVGANIVGVLFEKHCEAAFLTSGISLIICGFLSFFIPIQKENKKADRRISVTSMTGNYIKINVED